jgi:hypothetical protein
MDNIFTLGDGDISKINLDNLYERKKQCDLNTLKVFNRILQRIHNKIKHTSRVNIHQQYCWYVMPEIILGLPAYNHTECTNYIINKLIDNGFDVKYTIPNLMFISWQDWTPDYVRDEFRKKMGYQIDGRGNKKESLIDKSDINTLSTNVMGEVVLSNKTPNSKGKGKDYKDISTYKPTGIYNQQIFKRIEDTSKK